MTTFVVIEGRKPIPLPDEIANDEQAILKALMPFYPEAAEAEVKRENGPEVGDVTVKIIPRGKTKGGVGANHAENIITFDGKRLLLTSLHSTQNQQAIRLNFGIYENNGWRENCSGESVFGEIPLEALIPWAVGCGYLHYENADEWWNKVGAARSECGQG